MSVVSLLSSLPVRTLSAGDPPLRSTLLGENLSRVALALSLAVLAAHAGSLFLLASTSLAEVVSDLIQLAAALLAALAYGLAAARARGFVRRFCLLLAVSFTLWSGGQLALMYYTAYLGVNVPGLTPSDVPFLAAYLPLLAVIVMDGRTQPRRFHWIRTLDFAQVGIVISATYLYFLYYLPLAGTARQDLLSISYDIYSVLDLCVVGGFVLRVAFTPAGPMRSLFARLTVMFLAYCIGSALWSNARYAGVIASAGSLFDLAWSLPFVIATIGIATWKPGDASAGSLDSSQRGAQWICLLPALAPVLVMALAYHIHPNQPGLALLIGAASFLCCIARLALTQVRQRLALQALHAMERKFSKAFRSAPDSMTISTLQSGRYVAVNDRFLELFGFERDEVIGRTALELGIWADPWGRAAVVEQLSRQGRVRDHEAVFQTKSGKQLDVQISAETVELGGELCLVAGVRDITERKRAEDALLRSEARHRELVQGAAYGIYRATFDGKILYANPALVKMLGHDSLGDVLRLNTTRDIWVNPPERDRLTRETQGAGEMAGAEVQWMRKDGSVITVRLSARRVHDEAGNLDGCEAIVEDVTARRLLEEQFRQAQKMEAVGRLAAGVAHDFNNLLTVIQGYTDVALLGLDENSPIRGDLAEVQNAADHASDLTRQLLAFSRQQKLEPKLVDPNEVVHSLQKMLGHLLGENIRLDVQLSPELGSVYADSGQLEQVIMNLAVNAKDAMPLGGTLILETANVDLDEGYVRSHTGAKAGRYVRLTVRDTGTGMDEKTRVRIFEPFFTTKELGKGTGLGLATVYGVVKQSGGYIGVESEPGKGTSFEIYLPFVSCVESCSATGPRAEGVLTGSETILLIEDEESLRPLISDFLRQQGYEVLSASAGDEALAIAEQHAGEIHLAVTDVGLPGMSGREVADRMRILRPAAKVMFISGYNADTLLQHGISQPGAPVLNKPFTREGLVRCVRQVLDEVSAAAGCGVEAGDLTHTASCS